MLKFYLRKMFWLAIPRALLSVYRRVLEKKHQDESQYVESRVSYYCKLSHGFALESSNSSTYQSYIRKGKTSYYYDLKEYLRYFSPSARFAYHFGDETHINSYPTLFKARPQSGQNENSVLFKLDSPRHFRFVKDKLNFEQKKDLAVFRGAVHPCQTHRIRFLEKMFDSEKVDAGQTNPSSICPDWQTDFMSVEEQLKHKFIICLEGIDVASNLKWVMSSNSVVISPKMKFETWFMEGQLQAGVHYVEVKDDWSDFEDKMQYYLDNPEKAKQIVENAHQHVKPFLNSSLERHICIKTLQRYFELQEISEQP